MISLLQNLLGQLLAQALFIHNWHILKIQPNQKKMCPLRKMQVRGRPTSQANRNFRLLASQECFHAYFHLPALLFPSTRLLSQRSPPRSLDTVRARGPFSLNSLPLDLIQKPFPGSPKGNWILPLRNASPPWERLLGPAARYPGPCSPRARLFVLRSTGLVQVTLIFWNLHLSRIPHAINMHFFTLEAESNLWIRGHFLNGDSAPFLASMITSQLA